MSADAQTRSNATAVLLVEDSNLDARFAEGVLERIKGETFEVTRVRSLAAAFDQTESRDFDIVILDLGLPDSQGIQTLERMLAYRADIPVLVLTGTEDDALGQDAVQQGAQDYIPKSELQPQLLVRAIRYAKERHRTLRTLRETAELLSRTIASAGDAIITKTLAGIITSWNPAAEQLFGYSAAEAIGQSIQMLIPGSRVHEEEDILSRIRRGERVEHFETVRLHKDGREICVSVTISPIHDGTGNIVGASKITRDNSAQKCAEDALRKSEKQLRQFIEEAPVSVAMLDKEMCYLAASRRWIETYGNGRTDLIGTSHYELHPDIPQRWREFHRRGLAGETISNNEDRWDREDGSSSWLRWAIHPWHEGPGTVGGIIISVEDITAYVLAVAGLRFHENLLRETGHIAKVGGWEFDVPTGAGYWTEEVARIHELDPKTQPTKELGLGFYAPESRRTLERALEEAIRHGTPYDLELELTTAKGNHRWIRTIAHPVFLDGKVVKLRGSFQDISERKAAEGTLLLQASLIEQASDAITVWQEGGVITLWNQGAEKVYGYTKAEAVGRVIHELLHTSPARLDQALAALEEKGSWAGELEHVRRDGKRLTVESRMLQSIREGRRYVLETNRDVSDKRLLEEELRQSQRMEAIGRLAGGVAHDFNNLLGVILGLAELGSESTDLHKLRKWLAEISKAAGRAANLTRQLLAFSRKQVLEPRILDLNAKVAEVAGMLERLVGEDVHLHTSLAPDVGPVRVDPGQIEQILLNLVVNARDAMPNGGELTIETSNAQLDEAYARRHADCVPGPHSMIAVTDSGCGMDDETLAHIFEPFFTTKKTGTGLGLATVYGAVRQSGGGIWVYSELGKGTTFKIFFPRIEEAVAPAKSEKLDVVQDRGSETILLVEDSASLRAVTKEFLLAAGYTVIEATNGEEAVKVAKSHPGPIHLLLTDVVMPGMSGRDLAQEIQHFCPATRVLFVSGYTADAIVSHGVAEAGASFLSKPFSSASLRAKVREVLHGLQSNLRE